MRFCVATLALFTLTATAQKPFTLQQVLSAPYALQLTAAPVGDTFAWIENAEGRRNIWIAGPHTPARQLTNYSEDDAQDINQLAWSPDGKAIAYTYGAEDGADGHPANPAHLQRPVPLEIILQPLAPSAPATVIGEGHNPLFTRNGHSLYFLRAGQIWLAPLCAVEQNCHPERAQRVEGPAVPLAAASPSNHPGDEPHQLVYDRGSASSLTLSPDGQTLAFISTRREPDNPSHSFLALFNLTTHELTFPAPSTGNDSAPTFSPDGHHLAWLRAPFTRQPEYTPHLTSPNPWSIQLLDLATNTTHTVYQPEANKPGSVLPHIEDSSPYMLWASKNRLIFFSEADGWTHLYSINVLEPAAKPSSLTSGPYEVEDASLRSGGQMLYYSSNLEGMDLGKTGLTGMVSYAGPADAEGSYLSDRFADTDRRHVWRLDLDQLDKSAAKLRDDQGIQTHPVLSADGTTLAAMASSTSVPMHPVLMAIDPPIATITEVAKPPAYPAWATTQGGMTELHPSALPASYPEESFVMPQPVEFQFDKKSPRIHAQLFLPPHLDPHTKHATLIFVHGGPNRQMLLGYPGMDYYSNAYAMNQYLTSQGFIVLSVNYRGGTGYGLAFREAAHYGPDGASEYNDVLAAQKYLASRPDVDPTRIGIWGGSYGGYLTALALARNSNLFAAGVDFHGIHEWYLEGNPERWMTDPDHATAAQKDSAAALAHASSPMADIDHWRSPVLLIHGDNDPEVNYAQTPLLADALRARHVPVEELIFPDEVHGFLLHKDWLTAYQAAADFFIRTLKP